MNDKKTKNIISPSKKDYAISQIKAGSVLLSGYLVAQPFIDYSFPLYVGYLAGFVSDFLQKHYEIHANGQLNKKGAYFSSASVLKFSKFQKRCLMRTCFSIGIVLAATHLDFSENIFLSSIAVLAAGYLAEKQGETYASAIFREKLSREKRILIDQENSKKKQVVDVNQKLKISSNSVRLMNNYKKFMYQNGRE